MFGGSAQAFSPTLSQRAREKKQKQGYKCFLKKVAIFHASIAFQGNSAVV